jgi:hypothetical protein
MSRGGGNKRFFSRIFTEASGILENDMAVLYE